MNTRGRPETQTFFLPSIGRHSSKRHFAFFRRSTMSGFPPSTYIESSLQEIPYTDNED